MMTYRELSLIQTEEAQQTAFFQWVKMCELHGLEFADTFENKGVGISDFALIHHIPNGGERNKAVALKLKNQGVKKGIPDIFYPCPNQYYCGLYIEMKKIGGVLSKEQKKIIERLQKNGYCVNVCYTFNEARIALLEYYYGRKEIYN